MLKRNGPRIEPWDTPVITSFQLVKEPFIMFSEICCMDNFVINLKVGQNTEI